MVQNDAPHDQRMKTLHKRYSIPRWQGAWQLHSSPRDCEDKLYATLDERTPEMRPEARRLG